MQRKALEKLVTVLIAGVLGPAAVVAIAAASLTLPNSLCAPTVAAYPQSRIGRIVEPRIALDMVKPLRFSLFARRLNAIALPHCFTLSPKGLKGNYFTLV
jgi:hypothetical protein